MMTKTRSKIWLLVDVLSNFADTVNYTLISFLLWEGNESIELILRFNLIIFSSLLLGYLVNGIIQFAIGSKLTYLLALASQVAVALFAFTHVNDLQQNITGISLILGLSYSLISNSKAVLFQSIIPRDNHISFSSRKEVWLSVGSLLSPILTKFAIDALGYSLSFQVAAVIFVLLVLLFFTVRVESDQQKFSFGRLMIRVVKEPPLRNLVRIYFSLGVSGVFGWGLLNILILDVFGSLDSWRDISVGLALGGILIAALLRGINMKERSKAKFIIIIGSLFYALVPLLLLSNFTLQIFLIFLFTKLVFDKTNSIVTYNYLSTIESRYPGYEKEKLSFQMLNGFFTGIGRLIPIAVLTALPSGLININMLILTFAVISFIPLLFSNSYKTEYSGKVI